MLNSPVADVFGVGEAGEVAVAVLELVERPDPDIGPVGRFDARVIGKAVFEDLARLLPDLKAQGSRPGRDIGDDPGELVHGGPVLRTVLSIEARDRHQPLAVQAEPVILIVADTFGEAVEIPRSSTPGDKGQVRRPRGQHLRVRCRRHWRTGASAWAARRLCQVVRRSVWRSWRLRWG